MASKVFILEADMPSELGRRLLDPRKRRLSPSASFARFVPRAGIGTDLAHLPVIDASIAEADLARAPRAQRQGRSRCPLLGRSS